MKPSQIPANYVQNERGEYCHPSRIKHYEPQANTHLIALGAPEAHQRKRHPLSTLVKKSNGEYRRQASVGICITITSFRHRELDDDNLSTGAKPLRDAIATSLGVDDGDKRLRWEVRQVATIGAEGTLVSISTF